MKLPGLKGEWAKPDRIEVNEVGVPTYTWTFGAPVISGHTPLSEDSVRELSEALARGDRIVRREKAALDKKQRRRK